MMNVAFDPPKPLAQFAQLFRGCFTKRTFASLVFYLSAVLLEHRRLSIQSIAAKAPLASYERLQYFVSESKWSTLELNDRRLDFLKHKGRLKATREGLLILDDSACPKPYALATEAAEFQYASIAGGVIRCHTFVAATWAGPSHYFPIQIAPYRPANCFALAEADPAFRSKITLAKGLLRYSVERHIPFSDVLFDSWYLCEELLKELQSLQLTWISEAKGDRRLSYRGRWVRADELVKLIPSSKFNRTVTLPNRQDKQRTFFLASFDTRLQGLPYKLRCVVAVGQWDQRDEQGVHVFLSNRLSLSPDEIVRRYSRRWRIEDIFKELKDFLSFDQYQVRSLQAVEHLWHLALLAHTYLQWLKLQVVRSSRLKRPLSLGDALNLHRYLNDRQALRWIGKHPELYRLIRLASSTAA
jgi:hypothetical protein